MFVAIGGTRATRINGCVMVDIPHVGGGVCLEPAEAPSAQENACATNVYNACRGCLADKPMIMKRL